MTSFIKDSKRCEMAHRNRAPTAQSSVLSARVDLENKMTSFTFEVVDAIVNYQGPHSLQLSIIKSTPGAGARDYSGILLNTDALPSEFSSTYTTRTDVFNVVDVNGANRVRPSRFTFVLPRGFLVNDPSHDVYLLIESFADKGWLRGTRKYAECKFAIYPRPSQMNEKAALFEPVYRLTGALGLLRLNKENQQFRSSMHNGRIKFRAELKAIETKSDIFRAPHTKRYTPRDIGDATRYEEYVRPETPERVVDEPPSERERGRERGGPSRRRRRREPVEEYEDEDEVEDDEPNAEKRRLPFKRRIPVYRSYDPLKGRIRSPTTPTRSRPASRERRHSYTPPHAHDDGRSTRHHDRRHRSQSSSSRSPSEHRHAHPIPYRTSSPPLLVDEGMQTGRNAPSAAPRRDRWQPSPSPRKAKMKDREVPERVELKPQRKPGDKIADSHSPQEEEESAKNKPPAGPVPLKDYGYSNPIRTPPLGVVSDLVFLQMRANCMC